MLTLPAWTVPHRLRLAERQHPDTAVAREYLAAFEVVMAFESRGAWSGGCPECGGSQCTPRRPGCLTCDPVHELRARWRMDAAASALQQELYAMRRPPFAEPTPAVEEGA